MTIRRFLAIPGDSWRFHGHERYHGASGIPGLPLGSVRAGLQGVAQLGDRNAVGAFEPQDQLVVTAECQKAGDLGDVVLIGQSLARVAPDIHAEKYRLASKLLFEPVDHGLRRQAHHSIIGIELDHHGTPGTQCDLEVMRSVEISRSGPEDSECDGEHDREPTYDSDTDPPTEPQADRPDKNEYQESYQQERMLVHERMHAITRLPSPAR